MLEISPVLAGKYDAPDYIPAATNIASSQASMAATDVASADSSAPVDPRRYSQFDRTASQVGNADMSFGDFLDMVNPLQHIPVVSSIYRSITGDKINPVSRVAGDILYGAPMGILSGLAAGVGAVADSVMEAKTGSDVKGTVVAELFGSDKAAAGDAKVQVASAAGVTSQSLPEVQAQAQAAQTPTQAVASATPQQAVQAYGPAPNKMPFGGVMAPLKDMQPPEYDDVAGDGDGWQRGAPR